MSVLADVAELVVQGLPSEEIAEVINSRGGVNVDAAWIDNLRSADGFNAALVRAGGLE